MEAKSTIRATVPRWKAQIQRSSHTTLWCGSCVWKWMWSACADFYHSSHACYGTHCRSGPPHPAHSCAWCTYTYKSTHSLTCLRTPGGMACSSSPSLLGLLAQLALSSPQLACTPPLQLGTRLLRVALDPQRLIHANFATGSECYFAEHVETKEQTNTATNTKTHYNTQTHAQEPHYNMYSAVGGEEATSEKLVIGRKRARAPRGKRTPRVALRPERGRGRSCARKSLMYEKCTMKVGS